MKAKELKVGDYFFIENTPVKIKTLADSEISVVKYGEIVPAEISDLTPIPLTSEILEKNEWIWDENDWVFFNEFAPHIYLSPSDKNVFNVVDATGEQFGKISAVHELQHLLWALGIDDDLMI